VKPLNDLIREIISLRQNGKAKLTLLAVCPNSAEVLEAAVKVASKNNAPMLFAATLNQVDIDGGYTGWTPAEFVRQIQVVASKYNWNGPLYPCLDHGGPWLKDRHTLDRLSFDETMLNVKNSLTACVEAGYQLLHIDPTVDRTLPADEILPVEVVTERVVELIAHAEKIRKAHALPPISYEVGTEEVHGGLVDSARFEYFLQKLKTELAAHHLQYVSPCFIVAQVGTDLHTTFFDPAVARNLYRTVSPLGSLIKGHYTDWVQNPQEYPETGMGGANVGPEFTSAEYLALLDLTIKEAALCRNHSQLQPSLFMETLKQAVLDSGRWKKWLQDGEKALDFESLSTERQSWLLQTGARYVWTDTRVKTARQCLYANLSQVIPDPSQFVVDRIADKIDRYITAFNLFDSLSILED